MKNKGYYVIGGQYAAFNHGFRETLHGAKILATQKEEYWDNWQGWHKPAIYRTEDCEEQTNFYGEQMLPKDFAQPAAVWNGRKWEENETN